MWYKLKRILIYPDGVTEKQVYPYKYPYKPTSNTLLYMPLDWDLYKSGTATSTVTPWSDIEWQTILWDLKWIKFKGNANSLIHVSGIPELQSFTINCWVYLNDRSKPACFTRRFKANSARQCLQLFMRTSQSYKLAFNFFTYDQYSNSSMNTGTWYNVVATYNYSTRAKNIYLNGSNNWSTTSSWQIDFWTADIYIWDTGSNTDPMNWIMSNYILEDREWSSSEVSDYYNQTKSLYWL